MGGDVEERVGCDGERRVGGGGREESVHGDGE